MKPQKALTGAEKRRHPRLKERIQMKFKLLGGSIVTKDIDFVTAITKDISEGGVFMELGDVRISESKNLAVDNFLLFKSILDVRVYLPTRSNPVRAMGKTVWIEKLVPGNEENFKHGVAVTFTEISEEDCQAIRDYVNAKLLLDDIKESQTSDTNSSGKSNMPTPPPKPAPKIPPPPPLGARR